MVLMPATLGVCGSLDLVAAGVLSPDQCCRVWKLHLNFSLYYNNLEQKQKQTNKQNKDKDFLCLMLDVRLIFNKSKRKVE